MLAKPKTPIFIDNLTIEVEEANHQPFHVSLKSEDGKICRKTEKKISINNYSERTAGFTKYKNVLTKESGNLKDFDLGSYKTMVYELLK